MILDSSAIVAVLTQEPDAKVYADAIEATDSCKVSAATYLETAIVIDSKRVPLASRRFDDFFNRAATAIVPVDRTQVRIAREAYRDFGRGSGHPARLNFGDCFAYALAKALDEPLLYKGQDFSQIDVKSALP